MSKLRRRIVSQHRGAAVAAGEYHPAGTADTPMMMPLAIIRFAGGGMTLEQAVPLVTANGASIPASAPGRYGQVAIAGGGRHG